MPIRPPLVQWWQRTLLALPHSLQVCILHIITHACCCCITSAAAAIAAAVASLLLLLLPLDAAAAVAIASLLLPLLPLDAAAAAVAVSLSLVVATEMDTGAERGSACKHLEGIGVDGAKAPTTSAVGDRKTETRRRKGRLAMHHQPGARHAQGISAQS